MSKRELFEATLEAIDGLDPATLPEEAARAERVADLFVTAPRSPNEPSPVTMVLLNGGDAEVGESVRARYVATWLLPLTELLGSEARAAAFSAVIFGVSVAEKTLRLPGVAPPTSAEYEAELRHLLEAAIGGPS